MSVCSGTGLWSIVMITVCVCVQEGDSVFLASDIRCLKGLIPFCHQVHSRRIDGDGAKESNVNFLPVSVFPHFLKHFEKGELSRCCLIYEYAIKS